MTHAQHQKSILVLGAGLVIELYGPFIVENGLRLLEKRPDAFSS